MWGVFSLAITRIFSSPFVKLLASYLGYGERLKNVPMKGRASDEITRRWWPSSRCNLLVTVSIEALHHPRISQALCNWFQVSSKLPSLSMNSDVSRGCGCSSSNGFSRVIRSGFDVYKETSACRKIDSSKVQTMVSVCPVGSNKIPVGSGCKCSSSKPAARANCPAEIVGEVDALLASVKLDNVLAGEPWAPGGDFGAFLVRNGGMASGVAYAAYRSELDACAEAREEAREI